MKLRILCEYCKTEYTRGNDGGYHIGFTITTSTGLRVKDQTPEWNEATLDRFQAKRLANLFKKNAPDRFCEINYFEVKDPSSKVYI
jgi:hypothetical protein